MDDSLRKKIAKATRSSIPEPGLKTYDVDKLSAYSGQTATNPWEWSIYDGAKFPGGMGKTQVQQIDYWTLRRLSATAYNQNLYARGIVRRLLTNEINTGLTPEAIPDESILGFDDGALNDWTEGVESRFGLWAGSAALCDFKQRSTFGAIQRSARIEALVTGDCLVVLRQSAATKLPMVQLISGNRINTPLFERVANIPASHHIKHGVQFDSKDRIVGYWVRQDDGTFKRIPANGEKSGRRISWLVFGTDKRLDDVRGQPLLALFIQSLQDIDAYRDSTNRKALLNSFFAASVEREVDKPGTLPIQGGAIRNDEVNTNDGDGKPRKLNISKYVPGVTLDEMQVGEKLKLHTGEGTDLNFGTFEETITASTAWTSEIPPEILHLSFSNNYSASQAAINEFKIYLNKFWSDWGETFCTPIYIEHLIAESLLGKNPFGTQLLQSWRNNASYDIFAAWTSVEWYGSIKPSTDMLKQGKGSELLLKLGLSTHAREARGATGTKYSKNIKRLKRENEQKVEAWRPILEVRAEFGDAAIDNIMNQTTAQQPDDAVQAISDNVIEAIGESNENV